LPLTPANPSFLDARDAILLAIDNMPQAGRLKENDHKKVKADTWKVFAKFGMGVDAQSNGPSLDGIVASFDRLATSCIRIR
jgi:extracellular elastinolytic metalloproteinase